MANKYPVITLCGSTRFKDAFIEAQKRLTLEGNIVISVGLFGHSGDDEVWDGMNEGTISKTKTMLDDMHKRKIDMVDLIYVIEEGRSRCRKEEKGRSGQEEEGRGSFGKEEKSRRGQEKEGRSGSAEEGSKGSEEEKEKMMDDFFFFLQKDALSVRSMRRICLRSMSYTTLPI